MTSEQVISIVGLSHSDDCVSVNAKRISQLPPQVQKEAAYHLRVLCTADNIGDAMGGFVGLKCLFDEYGV